MIHTLRRSLASIRLDHAALRFALAAALLASPASLVALSLGDPELMTLVALAGAAVTLLALALLAALRSRHRSTPSETTRAA